MVDIAEAVRIAIVDGQRALDETGWVELSGSAPACLPASVGLAPNEGSADELEVSVELRPRVGDVVARRLRTRFIDGLGVLDVEFPSSCFGPEGCAAIDEVTEPAPATRESLDQRVHDSRCDDGLDPVQCVDRELCLGHGGIACATCPDRSVVEPPVPPEAPQAASLPRLFPCPGGFEAAEGGCDPRPGGRVPPCAETELWVVGSSTCAERAPCRSRWPESLPEGPTVYVDPRAPEGGDGSLAAPLAELDASTLAPGTVVAVAEGTLGATDIDRDLRVVGACVSGTELASIRVSGGNVQLANLRVLELEQTGGRLEFQGCDVERATLAAESALTDVRAGELVARGSSLSADRVMVVGPSSFEGAATLRRVALLGATTARTNARVSIREACLLGALTVEGEVVLEEALVTAPVVTSGDLSLRRATVDGDMESDGGSLRLDDVALRAAGVVARGASDLVARRVLVDRSLQAGLRFEGRATASLEDLTVTRPRAAADQPFSEVEDLRDPASASGLWVLDQARVTAKRVSISGHRVTALAVEGALAIADLSVSSPAPESDRAAALVAAATSEVEVERGAFMDARDVALRVLTSASASATVTLTDVDVGPTTGTPERRAGIGLEAGLRDLSHEFASIQLRRARFTENLSAAVALWRAHLTFEDLEAVGTSFDRATFLQGVALFANTGCVVSGARARILRSQSAGVTINGEGAVAELTDLEIRDSRCDDLDYCNLLDGIGFVVQNQAYGRVTRFVFSDNASSGAEMNLGAELDLEDGEVSKHINGVVVRAPSYDLRRVARAVHYRQNEINIFAAP